MSGPVLSSFDATWAFPRRQILTPRSWWYVVGRMCPFVRSKRACIDPLVYDMGPTWVFAFTLGTTWEIVVVSKEPVECSGCVLIVRI